MIWRFAAFELDEERRELRLRGREIVLEPQVFDALTYLVRNRDHVVTKDELLDRLWEGAVVTEGSIQRAVSLARSALRAGDAADAIRTYPRKGYRFSAEVSESTDVPTATQGEDGIAHARRAFERNDWTAALSGFEAADRVAGLAGPDLERAAWCFLNLGRPADAVPYFERAATAHSAAGDSRGTARAALFLSQIHLEGRRLTVARGWQQRAARLLEGVAVCRELAQFEWMSGRIALAEGNHDGALPHAERALQLAREIEDLDLEPVAMIYLGHVCVARGEVRRGLALHDEAAAAVLGSPVAPWFAGLVYCGLVYICQNRGDWPRAAHWTEGFTRWSERSATSIFPEVCRLHRAEVLAIQGDLATAEHELTECRDKLEISGPWAVGDAERLLGEVLRCRGDLEAAEQACRRAQSLGWDPCPGWAELLLERGDPAGAVRALERAVADPSWPCRQRRRILLAILARALAIAGDPVRARETITAAENVEDGDFTPAQVGALLRSRGEVAAAEGHDEEAIRGLRAAARFWQDLDCPLETAPIRMRLAGLLQASGETEAAAIEIEAAQTLWRKVGATSRAEACATHLERRPARPRASSKANRG